MLRWCMVHVSWQLLTDFHFSLPLWSCDTSKKHWWGVKRQAVRWDSTPLVATGKIISSLVLPVNLGGTLISTLPKWNWTIDVSKENDWPKKMKSWSIFRRTGGGILIDFPWNGRRNPDRLSVERAALFVAVVWRSWESAFVFGSTNSKMLNDCRYSGENCGSFLHTDGHCTQQHRSKLHPSPICTPPDSTHDIATGSVTLPQTVRGFFLFERQQVLVLPTGYWWRA